MLLRLFPRDGGESAVTSGTYVLAVVDETGSHVRDVLSAPCAIGSTEQGASRRHDDGTTSMLTVSYARVCYW